MVVINDVELAVFVFSEDLDEVIDERVMIINEQVYFLFLNSPCRGFLCEVDDLFSLAKVGIRGKINYFWLLCFII